jgi:hypothetical protein
MFERAPSRIGSIPIQQGLFTPISRRLAPDTNRDTVSNMLRAGFELFREESVHLDIVKAIEAHRPARSTNLTGIPGER